MDNPTSDDTHSGKSSTTPISIRSGCVAHYRPHISLHIAVGYSVFNSIFAVGRYVLDGSTHYEQRYTACRSRHR